MSVLSPTLWRFAWRELRRAKGRAGLIALILTIQAAALGGGYIAQDGLYHTRDVWSEKLHLADLDVHFVPASNEEMPSLESLKAIPGVAQVNRRFISFGYMEKTDGAPLPVVIQYVDPSRHPDVDDIEVMNGEYLVPGKPELAVVDRSFATAQNLKIGDPIVVNPHRFASKFQVGGTGLSAEYLVPTANPELLVPHKGSLGIIYASREALDKQFPDILYNDVVVTFAKGANKRATSDAVLAALGKLEIERVVTKEATFGYRFIDVMLSGSRSVTPIIAFIIALMAAIVAFISVHRLVAERRREIGTLLAQGYSPAQLAGCFFGLGLVPGVVGGLLGMPGAVLFARRVMRTTANISGFPDPVMYVSAKWLLLAAGCSVLVGLFSALPPTIGVLRMQPLHALRGGGEISFNGMPRILEMLLAGSTSVRYAVRNVFRRVRLSVATATLVALAVGLPSGLLTSIGSWDSWAKDIASQLKWDAIATFKVPINEAQVQEIMAEKPVASWDGYVQGYASVRREDGSVEEMRVRGLPSKSEHVTIGITSGSTFSSDEAQEAVLNSGFANGHPPHIGETITVVRRGVPHQLKVVGLVTQPALSTVIVPRTTAQRIFGLEGKVSGVYLKFGTSTVKRVAAKGPQKDTSKAEVLEKLDLDDMAPVAAAPAVAPRVYKDVKSALVDEELVTSVEVRTEYADATLKYLSSFNVIVVPFVALGGILAFFFLLSVLGFLLLEREAEYATLRSMGYGGAEIAKIVLTEVSVLAGMGLVLSLGTWAATAYALREPMAETWFLIPLDLRAHDFLSASIPTCAFLVFAALPGIRALMKMDLNAALRGRAIG